MNENLYMGVRKAAFATLFLYLDINLGPINILPKFVGYLLFLRAISYLQEENRDFTLLRPLAWLLTGWNLVEWLLKIFGIPLNVPVLGLIVTVVSLYFNFQMYTDLAMIAVRYDTPERGRSIRICRNIQTVLMTALNLPIPWKEDTVWQKVLLAGILLLGGIAAIALIVYLMGLKKALGEQELLDP